jgi:hypothetical protein
MKSILAVLWTTLVLSSLAGFAGELPEEPGMGLVVPSQPVTVQKSPSLLRRISLTDYALGGSVIAGHVADWITTQNCLRTSREMEQAGFMGICHEAMLPNALVENKVGFGFYEATTAGAEIYAQYMLTKHHHTRIARFAQLANIAGTAYVVAQNYHNTQAARVY